MKNEGISWAGETNSEGAGQCIACGDRTELVNRAYGAEEIAGDGWGTDVKTEIIFEDRDILVVYKPAGLATQTAGVGQQDVVSELKNYLWQKRMVTGMALGRPAPYLGVIHRLDQPVEGLLVFALNARAAGALTEQLRKQGEAGMLHKRYYGVVYGGADEEEGELIDYLYKNKDNMAIIVDSPEECVSPSDSPSKGSSLGGGSKAKGDFDAKKAVLRYHMLQTVDRSGTLTLADIHIFTGRFHQIRAQLAHAGMPLLGDMKYGCEASKAAARTLRIPNVSLCAYSLEFTHPVIGEEMSFRIKPRGRAFSFFSQ